jgi:hypothetical protein
MLLAKELLEIFREAIDGVRAETDEEKDVFRLFIRLVPFICEMDRLSELVVPLDLGISPALSARVFRFGAGSGTTDHQHCPLKFRYHQLLQRTSRYLMLMADRIWWRHHVCSSCVIGRRRHLIQAFIRGWNFRGLTKLRGLRILDVQLSDCAL